MCIPIAGKPPPVLDYMEGYSKMSMGLELYNGDKGKPFKMGESPSFGTLASARGMAKLAAAMADRGQASNSRTVETVYRVAVCPRGNLPYIRPFPINNTIYLP